MDVSPWKRSVIEAARDGRVSRRCATEARTEYGERIRYDIHMLSVSTRDVLDIPELWQVDLLGRPSAPLWSRDALEEELESRMRDVRPLHSHWQLAIRETYRGATTRSSPIIIPLQTGAPFPETTESVLHETGVIRGIFIHTRNLLRDGMTLEQVIDYVECFDGHAARAIIERYAEDIAPSLLRGRMGVDEIKCVMLERFRLFHGILHESQTEESEELSTT